MTPPCLLQLAFLLPLVTACSGHRAVADESLCAGVPETRMMDHVKARYATASEARLRIGGADARRDIAFTLVTGVVRLTDGRLVVADGANQRISLFARDGAMAGGMGRRGKGPGELEFIDVLARLGGDTLLAYDNTQDRVVLYRSDGSPAGGYRVGAERGLILTDGVAVLSGHRLVLTNRGLDRIAPSKARVEREQAEVLIAGPDGSIEASLGRFPTRDVQVREFQGGVKRQVVPFGRLTQFAALGSELFVVTGDRYEICVFDTTGVAVRRLTWSRLPRPVTPEDAAGWRQAVLDRVVGGPDAYARRKRELEALLVPETMPAFADIAVGSDGMLWLREPEVPGKASEWWVVDPSGGARTIVELPEGLRPWLMDLHEVIGTRRDSLHVPVVEAWRLFAVE